MACVLCVRPREEFNKFLSETDQGLAYQDRKNERKEPTEGCERHEMGKWLIRLLLLDMLRSRRQ